MEMNLSTQQRDIATRIIMHDFRGYSSDPYARKIDFLEKMSTGLGSETITNFIKQQRDTYVARGKTFGTSEKQYTPEEEKSLTIDTRVHLQENLDFYKA